MREDFGRVIIERPRRGSRWRNVKIRHFGKFIHTDEGIEYEGLTRIPSTSKAALLAYRDRKDPSDLLGPLHKYLKSSCGRPWDDVYSEIAHTLGRFTKSEGIRHIVDAHIDVYKNTFRGDGGGVYENTARWRNRGRVDVHSYSRGHFYIEPETGLLRASRFEKRKFVTSNADAPNPTIPIDNLSIYERIDGIWYLLRYEMRSGPHHKSNDFQVFAGTLSGIPAVSCTICNSKPEKVLISKRQAGKKELKWIRNRHAAQNAA